VGCPRALATSGLQGYGGGVVVVVRNGAYTLLSLDPNLLVLLSAHASDKLTSLVRGQAVWIAVFQGRWRGCSRDHAFDLEVSCAAGQQLQQLDLLIDGIRFERYLKVKVAKGCLPYGYVASCDVWAAQAFASPSLWYVSNTRASRQASETHFAVWDIARPFKHFSGRLSPVAGVYFD